MQLIYISLSIFLLFTSCKTNDEIVEPIAQEIMQEPIRVNYTDIEIICIQKLKSSYIITNDKQYQDLLNGRSAHPDCPQYVLPYINFNKNTLLGFHTVVGGCSSPKIQKDIIKNNKNYIFRVSIEQEGACKIAQSISDWCLIPKINNNDSVSFEQKSF
jgi:hypothetical protein